MDREPDAYSVARTSTVRRRSIVTITDRQTLSIDLSLTSTDTFPSVFADEKTRSPSLVQEKSINMSTETIQENRENEKKDEPSALVVPPTPKYLSGYRLFLVMTCVTLVCWLMFLDSSIIVTVSQSCRETLSEIFGADTVIGHSSDYRRIPLSWRYWLVWKRVSPRKRSISAPYRKDLSLL